MSIRYLNVPYEYNGGIRKLLTIIVNTKSISFLLVFFLFIYNDNNNNNNPLFFYYVVHTYTKLKKN